MEDDHRNDVQDWFSRHAMGIPLNGQKLWFKTWTHERKWKVPNFNGLYIFELLPQHLEHEVLQSYEEWTAGLMAKLRGVEDYWVCEVQLVAALKECVIMESMLSI